MKTKSKISRRWGYKFREKSCCVPIMGGSLFKHEHLSFRKRVIQQRMSSSLFGDRSWFRGGVDKILRDIDKMFDKQHAKERAVEAFRSYKQAKMS